MTHVVLFRGSFDPPHEGHRFIVETALRELKADLVVVMPHETHRYKPNMGPWHHRVAMLKLMFSQNPQVLVWEGTKNEAYHKYIGNTFVSYLIGADGWNNYSKESALGYNQLVISGRRGYSLPRAPVFHDIPIRLIEVEGPEYSSTYIRKNLGEATGLLDPKVREYILQNGLYSPTIPTAH